MSQYVVFSNLAGTPSPTTPPTSSTHPLFTSGTWTPTATPESGTLGTVTAMGQTRQGEGVLFFSLRILIAGRGTATGSLTFGGLPEVPTSLVPCGVTMRYNYVIYPNGYIDLKLLFIKATANFQLVANGRGIPSMILGTEAVPEDASTPFTIWGGGFTFI